MTDEKFLRRWGKARRRGYWHYLLTQFLAVGVSMAVTYLGVIWIWNDPVDLTVLAAMAGVLAVMTLFIGHTTWRSSEDRYHQLTSGRSAQAFD